MVLEGLCKICSTPMLETEAELCAIGFGESRLCNMG